MIYRESTLTPDSKMTFKERFIDTMKAFKFHVLDRIFRFLYVIFYPLHIIVWILLWPLNIIIIPTLYIFGYIWAENENYFMAKCLDKQECTFWRKSDSGHVYPCPKSHHTPLMAKMNDIAPSILKSESYSKAKRQND